MVKRNVLILFFLLTSITLYSKNNNVLFLHTWAESYPWSRGFNEGLDVILTSNNKINLFTESLNYPFNNDSFTDKDLINYFKKKYSNKNITGVFAEGHPASLFINKYGEEIFGNIPKVLHSYNDLELKPNTYYFKNQQDEALIETIKLSIMQNPNKKEIVIVNGKAKLYRSHIDQIKEITDKYSIKITEISNFVYSDLIEQIQNLSGNEIVLYFLVSSDITGTKFIPKNVLKELGLISPSPIYTFWNTFLDTQCIGGMMVDSKKIFLEMFRALDDFNNLGYFKNDYSTIQGYINWKQEHKFNLKKITDPKYIIYNTQESIFKKYFTEILIIFIIICILFLVLALYSRKKIILGQIKLEEALAHQKTLLKQQEILKDDLIETSKLSSLGMMIAGVSHELNTPIGAGIIVANQLEDSFKNFKNKIETGISQNELTLFLSSFIDGINLLKKNQQKSVSLIERFKRLSFERTKDNLHTFKLLTVVEDVIEPITPLINNKYITITYNIPEEITLKSYYGPLSMTIQNLISNSIEHAFNVNCLEKRISVIAKEKNKENVVISIKDSGVGIKEEIKSSIYDPFVTSRRFLGNTGLGLHFVHQWVTQVLKGKLSFTTEIGKGTEFIIILPKKIKLD